MPKPAAAFPRRRAVKPMMVTVLLPFVCILSLIFGERLGHPVAAVGRLLGAEDAQLPCNEAKLVWLGIVLVGMLVIVAAFHLLRRDDIELGRWYETSWLGLGEDVDTTGFIEPMLKLATVTIVILLASGLVYATLGRGTSKMRACRELGPATPRSSTDPAPARPPTYPEGSDPPTAVQGVVSPRAEPNLSGVTETLRVIATALDSISQRLADHPQPNVPVVSSPFAFSPVGGELAGIEQTLEKIAAALPQKPSPVLPACQGSNCRRNTAAVHRRRPHT